MKPTFYLPFLGAMIYLLTMSVLLYKEYKELKLRSETFVERVNKDLDCNVNGNCNWYKNKY